jgi:hypothetical protein
MNRFVIGIDPDVERIAWAAFEDGRHAAHGTIRRTRTEKGARVYHPPYLLDMPRFFARAAERKALMCLEDVYLAFADGKPLVSTYKALAGVQGELAYLAWQAGIDLEFVSPLAWHRTQLPVQKGREAIQKASFERARFLTGESIVSPHEADAICITAHGLGLTTRATKCAV